MACFRSFFSAFDLGVTFGFGFGFGFGETAFFLSFFSAFFSFFSAFFSFFFCFLACQKHGSQKESKIWPHDNKLGNSRHLAVICLPGLRIHLRKLSFPLQSKAIRLVPR